MSRRVVVTGLGLTSPVGNDLKSAWNNITNGVSGIDNVKRWQEADFAGKKLPVTIGGEVKDFNPRDWIEPVKDVRKMSRMIQFSMAAGKQAWEQSGLSPQLEDKDANRAGVILGIGLMGLDYLISCYDSLVAKGPSRVTPFFIPASISNMAAGHLAIKYNLRNSNFVAVSACASGGHAIGEAMQHIICNRADIMIAGGSESSMHPLSVAGFASMKALCESKNDCPTLASRPFDKDRNGFVMAEGAGVLVLEELEHAKARNANILAEISGYGSTCDAYHMTAPAQNGFGAKQAMQQALHMAQINPEQVGYINAHGTSTKLNDASETQAIKEVFKQHAKSLLVSSTKSMTGHLLGAAGGVEAIFTIMALKAGIIPPTINYTTADPQCDLDYVANTAKEKRVEAAISNSFGFGGSNAVLLFKRYDDN